MATTALPPSNSMRTDIDSIHKHSEDGHYVVTAHRPGVVLLAKRCSFLGPDTIVSSIIFP